MINSFNSKPVSRKEYLYVVLVLFGVFTSFVPKKQAVPAELGKSIEKRWPGSQLIHQEQAFIKNCSLFSIQHNNKTVGKAYIKRVLSCRAGGCESKIDLENDASEYFDYYAILTNANSVMEIKVYNYEATHGEEVCSKAWLKQFKGYNGDKKLRYGKEIDAISGATISGIALTEDIEKTVKLLNHK